MPRRWIARMVHGVPTREYERLRRNPETLTCGGRPQREFKCPACISSFKSEAEYKEHWRSAHAPKPIRMAA